MATICGIVVTKAGEKFVWKVGLALWEFKQWPAQLMWRNGHEMTDVARDYGIKLYDDAVRVSIGFELGMRKACSDLFTEADRS